MNIDSKLFPPNLWKVQLKELLLEVEDGEIQLSEVKLNDQVISETEKTLSQFQQLMNTMCCI